MNSEKIIKILSDRRGFSDWWCGIDKETKEEIKRELDETPKSAAHSSSYKECPTCGVDCAYLNTEYPCWGEVYATDEIAYGDDYQWIHECEGHNGCFSGGKYKPEKNIS